MATTEEDPVESVERRRAQLEKNITKLRQSLRHWQTWEYEYEMLKEEIQSVNAPSTTQIAEIGRELGGSLVTEKEVEELLGKNLSTKRNANQIVDMISRRVDYVQQNITTIQKQLGAAAKKLDGMSVLLEPDVENEEGLPWFDIEEELDEEGNVVSSSVSQPGKSAPELVEVLRKTGIKKGELEANNKSVTKEEFSPSPIPATGTTESTASNRSSTVPMGLKSTPRENTPSKKSVSFAQDTKSESLPNPAKVPRPVYAMPAPDPKPASSNKVPSTLESGGYNETLADYNFTRGTKVIELDDNDNEVASYPIIPQDETSEAAELRRQMLQYGLSEVGAVIAEIDLERPTVDYSGNDDDDDGMYDYYDDDGYDLNEDSEAEEEEDQYGRATRPVLTDEYKKQMMELEKRLNARMMENVGPRPDTHFTIGADDVRTLKVAKDEAVDKIFDTTQSAGPDSELRKKGVRFASNLDVSPPQTVKEPIGIAEIPAPRKQTMSDTIVERFESTPQPPIIPSKSAKVSQFKSAKASSTQPIIDMLPHPIPDSQSFPSGLPGRTLTTEIIEKPFQSFIPQPPNEFDPTIVNRQIQVEYHKMRNTMINHQGGFMSTEAEKEDPLMEERNGKVRKVSRFMAAQLRPERI